MNLIKKKDKSALSFGKSKTVHGVTIHKMPIGTYLKALTRIQTLPEDLMQTCFPDQNTQDILNTLTTVDSDGLVRLLMTALGTVPQYVVSVTAELTGVPEAELLENPEIGLNGLVDILLAFIEVNELGEFISGVNVLRTKINQIVQK